MDNRKSDIGSFIGIALGLVVIFWGMTDWPAGKIADKKSGPTWDQKILSQPFGWWDEEWQGNIDSRWRPF